MIETVSPLSEVLLTIKNDNFEPIFEFSIFRTKVSPTYAPESSVAPTPLYFEIISLYLCWGVPVFLL